MEERMRGARERGAVRVREERAQGRERRGSVVFLFFFVLALFHCFDLAFNLFFSSRGKREGTPWLAPRTSPPRAPKPWPRSPPSRHWPARACSRCPCACSPSSSMRVSSTSSTPTSTSVSFVVAAAFFYSLRRAALGDFLSAPGGGREKREGERERWERTEKARQEKGIELRGIARAGEKRSCSSPLASSPFPFFCSSVCSEIELLWRRIGPRLRIARRESTSANSASLEDEKRELETISCFFSFLRSLLFPKKKQV